MLHLHDSLSLAKIFKHKKMKLCNIIIMYYKIMLKKACLGEYPSKHIQ